MSHRSSKSAIIIDDFKKIDYSDSQLHKAIIDNLSIDNQKILGLNREPIEAQLIKIMEVLNSLGINSFDNRINVLISEVNSKKIKPLRNQLLNIQSEALEAISSLKFKSLNP